MVTYDYLKSEAIRDQADVGMCGQHYSQGKFKVHKEQSREFF
jgi:hypothetical protein